VLATGITEGGVCWMLMPLLDGASVGGLLQVLERIPLVWTLEIARAVCSALAAVHAAAIHRDIKPDNVFVTRSGRIFVLDWGAGKFYAVGRLTTTGTTLGTIPYSSPEQLRDPDSLDGRSDLFSVGILTFQMLTGKHPFQSDGALREDPITLGYRIIHEEPRSMADLAPELPSYVWKITHKLLRKAREERSRGADETAEVFVAAQNELKSRLGAPLPVARIFDAYDEIIQAQEQARLALVDTEKTAATVDPSGPWPKLGTVPLAAFVEGPPPAIADPPAARPPPAPLATGFSGGTAPMARAAGGASGGVGAGGTTRMNVDVFGQNAAVQPPSLRSAAQGGPLPASGASRTPAPEGRGADEETVILRRLQAIERLSRDDAPETRAVLLDVLRDHEESPIVRAAAARALAIVGDATCLDELHDSAERDPDPLVRRLAEAAVLEIAVQFGHAVEPLPRLWGAVTPPVSPPPQPEGAAGPLARAPREWSTAALVLLAVGMALVSAAIVAVVFSFVAR
jgi:hypothetical protein